MDISVVIPVKDEHENVDILASEISASLRLIPLSSEIIFVDDGSTDGTLEKLITLKQQQQLPNLRIISHSSNYGQSTALHTGIKFARGQWIVTMDGDGQNDPADIPNLVSRMNQESASSMNTLIAGYRKNRKDTRVRRLSSRIANSVRSTMLRDQTPDTGCGLKMISRDLFLQLPFFDHMHRFLPALVIRQGGQVISVEVNHRQRQHGKSKYGINNRLWVGIVDLFGVMWLIRRGKNPVAEEAE